MKSAMRLYCFLFAVLISSVAFAQPDKVSYSVPTKAKVIVLLRDFAKQPIAKADVWLENTEGNRVAEGKTDRDGVLEVQVPYGQTYWIGVEDSAHYDQITLEAKPYLVTRRIVYFQGTVNGKPTVVASPLFNMMPPQDGLAQINFSFVSYGEAPLVGEEVTLVALGSGKAFKGSTDAAGKLVMKVPIGENYRVALKYNANFDQLNFPNHGGSYNVKLSYGYAGSAAIEQARRERAIRDSLYNAYRLKSLEEQKKMRDANMHKQVFVRVEIRPAEQINLPFETPYGYSIATGSGSELGSPLYMDGKIIVGGGFSSSQLLAFDASTGERLWAVNLGEGGPCSPVGANGIVVVITESCTIYAIDAGTGQLVWSKWLSPYVLSSAAIANGKVYVAYQDKDGSDLLEGENRPSHVLACMDLANGDILWQQWIHGEVMSAVVTDGSKVYCNTFTGYSYVVDAADGKVIAAQRLYATSAPTPAGALVYMSQRASLDGPVQERIAAFSTADLSLKAASRWFDARYIDWKLESKSQHSQAEAALSMVNGFDEDMEEDLHSRKHAEALVGVGSVAGMQMYQGSRPLLHQGQVVASMGGKLLCFQAVTLKPLWEVVVGTEPYDKGGRQLAPPIFAGGKLHVVGWDGKLRSYYPETGKLASETGTGEVFRTPAIAVHGWVFAGSTKGKLVAIDMHDAKIDGWYMWGGGWSRANVAP